MRTTLRIDDDVLRELKQRSRRENTSLAKLVNQMLRTALNCSDQRKAARPFRQKVHSMGAPSANLDKALSLAAALEDDEIVAKLSLRK